MNSMNATVYLDGKFLYKGEIGLEHDHITEDDFSLTLYRGLSFMNINLDTNTEYEIEIISFDDKEDTSFIFKRVNSYIRKAPHREYFTLSCDVI